MNNRANLISQIEDFMSSDEKCMLITGTHQYEKHKTVIEFLEEHYKGLSILFRSSGMCMLTNREFLGFAGVSKQPKAGAKFNIGRNLYQCDSFNKDSTMYKTSNDFIVAIVYPLDSILKNGDISGIENLFSRNKVEKIFLITWTDRKEHDLTKISEYVNRYVIYDAKEEIYDYHIRVLENMK